MTFTNEFDHIRAWANDKGIIEYGTPLTQFAKAAEEMGELSKAVVHKNKAEVADAIGDIVVVLTSLAAQHQLTIEECINGAYNIIAKRKGTMVNNDFVKDSTTDKFEGGNGIHCDV